VPIDVAAVRAAASTTAQTGAASFMISSVATTDLVEPDKPAAKRPMSWGCQKSSARR